MTASALSRLRHSLAREQRALLTLLGVVIMLTAFGMLASEVLEGETRGFDTSLTYLFRLPPDHVIPIGSPWLPDIVIDLTALGSVAVLTLITLLAVAFLLLRSRWKHAAFVAVAIGLGTTIAKLLKAVYARPRPDIVPHLVHETTLSFPSGHATDSAIVYLTLAMLLASAFRERRLRLFVLGTGAFLTALVGTTRVYLGVHYPSDVIAGWIAGAAWALAMSLIARLLQRRRSIEQSE